jgi:hypothetical protein
MKITQEQLKELVNYDPGTGLMTWRKPRRKCRPGDEVGRFVKEYRQVYIEGRTYYVHVLAFLYMTGEWPKRDMDHDNTIKSDNRWVNLRPATRSQNKANAPVQGNNKLGLKGVSWSDRDRVYEWSVKCGRRRLRGRSDCPASAHFSYVVAADKLFGEFAYLSGGGV